MDEVELRRLHARHLRWLREGRTATASVVLTGEQIDIREKLREAGIESGKARRQDDKYAERNAVIIKALEDGTPASVVAKRFGLTPRQICNIRNGKK